MKVDLVCDTCGEGFKRWRAWVRPAKKRFCSQSCQNAALINRIEKNCKTCGVGFLVRLSEDKKFSSCPDCVFKNRGGDNNSNWRGGRKRRPESGSKQWREAILERDGHACLNCGSAEKLEAHHIKPISVAPELATEMSNGATLCRECHKLTYTEVGKWRSMGKTGNEYDPSAYSALLTDRLLWKAWDLDGTLAESIWPIEGIGEPIPEGIAAAKRHHELGYKITIWTSRPWWHYPDIEKWLIDHEVPFRRIICGKLLAGEYVDDRATKPYWVKA